jgi:hypothetical protein
MDSRKMGFRNPFPRPWMEKTGAAAAVGGSSVGLKGIIAGKYYRNCKSVQVLLPGGKRFCRKVEGLLNIVLLIQICKLEILK